MQSCDLANSLGRWRSQPFASVTAHRLERSRVYVGEIITFARAEPWSRFRREWRWQSQATRRIASASRDIVLVDDECKIDRTT